MNSLRFDKMHLGYSVVVQYVESGSGEEEQLAALHSDKCPQETVRAIFSGMYTILSAALRQPNLKQEVCMCVCSYRVWLLSFCVS